MSSTPPAAPDQDFDQDLALVPTTDSATASYPAGHYALNAPTRLAQTLTATPTDDNRVSEVDFDTLPILCLSHLRWDFVYQRPQHLLSRFARTRQVIFFEEPMLAEGPEAGLRISEREGGVTVVVPELPWGLDGPGIEATQARLLEELVARLGLERYILWYYTPMAVGFSRHLTPELTVFDCMDELSAFKGASPDLLSREAELLAGRADVVFTGGQSIYEAKKDRHGNVHAMPSSIDPEHFRQARTPQPDPDDLAPIPQPRIGFYGVIDERFDIDLLADLARLRPDYQWVVLGPVVKIDPSTLPKADNIHYLPGKSYQELPTYLAGWQAAMMPFALNEATRYISPTKTPEFLAAGRPVVSTAIRDVVYPYGEQGLVHIAHSPEEFAAATDRALVQAQDPDWQARTDAFLSRISWDRTHARMQALMKETWQARPSTPTPGIA